MKYLNKIFAIIVAFIAYLACTWILFDVFSANDGMKFIGVIISLAVAIAIYKIINKFVNSKSSSK